MTSQLPYRPSVQAVLNPLRAGFRRFNAHVAAPLLRAGYGPLLSTPEGGSILLLRTTGRRTGQPRDAPLGYAVVNGRVVVVAGYGRGTHWFRNAQADSRVEVIVAGCRLAGEAEEVTDPAERRDTFRRIIASLGRVGTLTLGDVHAMDDTEVDTLAEAFPMLAITPTAVLEGPFDPGGLGTLMSRATWIAVAAGFTCASARRALRVRSRRPTAPVAHPG